MVRWRVWGLLGVSLGLIACRPVNTEAPSPEESSGALASPVHPAAAPSSVVSEVEEKSRGSGEVEAPVRPSSVALAEAVSKPATPAKPALDTEKVRESIAELLSLVFNDPELTVMSVKRDPRYFLVTYERSGESARQQTIYVTLDGRYASMKLLDIQQRVTILGRDQMFSDCMERAGFKVFVEPGQEASEAQLDELGVFAERVVVNCGGARRSLCEAQGYKRLPVSVWKGGRKVGVMRRGEIEISLKCY